MYFQAFHVVNHYNQHRGRLMSAIRNGKNGSQIARPFYFASSGRHYNPTREVAPSISGVEVSFANLCSRENYTYILSSRIVRVPHMPVIYNILMNGCKTSVSSRSNNEHLFTLCEIANHFKKNTPYSNKRYPGIAIDAVSCLPIIVGV